MAAAAGHGEEMKSIYAGPKVVPVRLGRPAFGPESLAFDHRGGGPYTGVSNGRILRWRADRRRPAGWTEFAHNYKHATVAECAARKKKAAVAAESVCGRPLGVQFHRRTGEMYIADAYLGLMRVGRRGGLATVVATEAGGVPLNFVNGVDVDQDTGDVYFTDSSTTYQRSDYLLVVLSGDATGRLLRYEPRTGNVTVLKSGLAFPNGVAVSADGTHLVVAETASCRLLRHWLRGSNAGATEVLAELPGYPDNVRPAAAADDDDSGGGRGGASYWVALNRDKAWTVNGTTPASVAAVRVVVDDDAGAGKVAVALRGFGGATMAKIGVIRLKIFSGCSFSKDNITYQGCSSIHEFDKDYMSYFKLRDRLKEFGLKENDCLYYLKPRYFAPNGLVLLMDDNQCIQLLTDHEGKNSCNLYIVPDPTRLVMNEESPVNSHGRREGSVAIEDIVATSNDEDSVEDETHSALNETDDYSSGVEIVPEHEVENMVVDAGDYIFDGDGGDDELYSVKKQHIGAKQYDKVFTDGSSNDNGKGQISERSIRRARNLAKQNATASKTRDEPVVTMLEHMRCKVMESYATKDECAQKDTWSIAPNYQKRLELQKELASFCRPICAGRGIWQVSMGEFTFTVDLNRTSGCRKWDVTGIPCCHVVSTIQKFNLIPKDYVDGLFKKEAYFLTY
uniref:Zinc finger PMZ-type domain-containing protein n=1 Tax=Oryza punctata TaxID=4537 RepID=A0A0E0M0K8_ORYPU